MAGSDIFGRAAQEFGGAIAADSVKLNFSGAGATLTETGMLAQQLQIQYQQQVTRIYEIGTNFTYFVVGRTSGQVSMNRIIGPKAVNVAFYKQYGDACKADQNNLAFKASSGCFTNGNGTLSPESIFTTKHVLINQIGMNVNSSDMLVNEQVAMMFNSLTLD